MHRISQFSAEIRQKIVGGGVAEPLKSLCFGTLVICVCLGYAYAGPSGGTVIDPGDFGEVEVTPNLDCSLVTCYKKTYSECTGEGTAAAACCFWNNNVCKPNCETYGINGLQPGCFNTNGEACLNNEHFYNNTCGECVNMDNTTKMPKYDSNVINGADWSPHTGIVEESGECPWQISCGPGNYISDTGCTLCDLGYISPFGAMGIYYPSDNTHTNVCQSCYQEQGVGNNKQNRYDVLGFTSNAERTACDRAAVRKKDGDEYSYIYIAQGTSKSVPDEWFDDGGRTYTAGQCRALKCQASKNKNPNSIFTVNFDCSTLYIYKIGDGGPKMQVVPGEPIRTLTLVPDAPCPKDYYCPGGESADPIPCGNGMVTDGTGKSKPTDCMITKNTEFCDSRGCFYLPIGDKKIPAYVAPGK